MKIIRFILFCLLFFVLFLFAYNNVQKVPFNIPFIANYQISLIIILFITFIIGAFLGICSVLFRILSLRKTVNNLRRELKTLRDENSHLINPQATTVVVKDNVTTVEN